MRDDGLIRFDATEPTTVASATPFLISEAGSSAPTTLISTYLDAHGLACGPRDAHLRADQAGDETSYYALHDVRSGKVVDPKDPDYRADGHLSAEGRPRYALRPITPEAYKLAARYLRSPTPKNRSQFREAARAQT